MPDPTEPGFVELLEYLRRTRGFDFTGYKPSSLMSRIHKRMQMLGIDGFAEYQDHLEVHPEEFGDLFNYMLINVTSFFRDPTIWKYVAEAVVPVVAERAEQRPIRIWSAGCASGEEAYTMAMLLAEGLGRDTFARNVKIYATDVDEEALADARAATYPRAKIDALPEGFAEKYFEPAGSDRRVVFDKELRRSVIFGRHNLVADAPISRIDLLACRNTLMYLNAETQAQVLNNFHFALNEDGFLVLGKAEMLFTKEKSFVAVDLKRRVFRKLPGEEDHARLWLTPSLDHHSGGTLDAMVDSLAFDASPVAQIILDTEGLLVGANLRAREMFHIRGTDIGRTIHEIEPAHRPVDLVAPLQQVISQRASVQISDVFFAGGPPQITHISVDLAPLMDNRAHVSGILISYSDVSRLKKMEEDLHATSQELETALEELQSTNVELETTNQELQSTNEELETTNQELQSTNEELEMMNEELESTNDELQAVNDEARRRSGELDEAHLFLQSVLSGLSSGVVVIDSGCTVTMWNREAEELWGLRAGEASGQALEHLDIGLPLEGLMPRVRRVLSGESSREQVTLEATNRRGKPITCVVSVGPLGTTDAVLGAILAMEEQAPVKAS
jgi:two-component system CheB/CheR fusion protein